MMPSVWIVDVLITPEVEHKLWVKHGLKSSDVEEAVRFGAYREGRWHEHPIYGRRLLVKGETFGGVPVIAYLRPIDEAEGIWECRTARRVRL